MYLSKKTTITVSDNETIVLGHMAYAASKLWNVANYQKRNYKELGLTSFPNGYDQNVSMKNNLWYKSLPSQTAQACLAKLHDSWKSYFKLLKTKGVQNPRPPRYKRDVIPFVFIQNGFKKMEGDTFRFSISKQLKLYLQEKFSIEYDYLFLKIKCFSELGAIKQIQFEKIAQNRFSVIATYEVKETDAKEENGKYLSIDLGVNNFATISNNIGATPIIIKGGVIKSRNQYFNKRKAFLQSELPIGTYTSKRLNSLSYKRENFFNDYFYNNFCYIFIYDSLFNRYSFILVSVKLFIKSI